MNAVQLKGDLAQIEGVINRDVDVTSSTKRLLGELVEWNRGFVDVIADLQGRLALAEQAIDDVQNDVTDEGISTESGAVLLQQIQQSTMVNVALRAFLKGPKNSLEPDETAAFTQLLDVSDQQNVLAKQLIADLVVEEDEDDDA